MSAERACSYRGVPVRMMHHPSFVQHILAGLLRVFDRLHDSHQRNVATRSAVSTHTDKTIIKLITHLITRRPEKLFLHTHSFVTKQ